MNQLIETVDNHALSLFFLLSFLLVRIHLFQLPPPCINIDTSKSSPVPITASLTTQLHCLSTCILGYVGYQ